MNKVLLKNLCRENEIGKYGIPASAEDYDESKIRYLRISDIDDWGNLLNNDKKSVSSDDIDKYILNENDLVVARTGNSTGRTYFHEEKNGLLAFAGFLIKYGLDEKKVNPKYLKYYTISSEYRQWVKNLSVGSTRGNINAQTFADCPISLPCRMQQDLLVSVLSSLDSKIALNNRINAELEAMAKTVYDYWFVQFDFPFDFAQGKPSPEGKPYKSSGGKMVWSEELKREVPEGWEVGTLNDITNITTGKLDSNAEVSNAEYPFYTCAAEPTKTDTYAYDDTVILIAGNNASGNFHINRFKGKFNAYQRTYIVTAKELIDLEYIYQVLNTETRLLKTQGKGSQTKFLTIGMLTGIKIIKNKELMTLFYEMVNPMYEKQEVHRKENQQLSSLRDWLLPMLMNGQVKVGSGYEGEVESLMAAEAGVKYGVETKKANI